MKIKNDITFHRVGDTVTYKITVVNNESEKYTIKSLTDNNENAYLTYEYDSYEGTPLDPKEEKTFEITAKYKNEVTGISKRDQSLKVVFTFALENKSGDVKGESLRIEDDTNTKNSKSP